MARARRRGIARAHEALGVDGDAAAQPVGLGVGADEKEDVAQRHLALAAGALLAPAHARQAVRRVAVQRRQLGAGQQRDVGRGIDPVDQVARHAGRQAGAAHQHVDLGRVLGEEDGRLAGGVAAAHQGHLGAAAHARLQRGRPVPDAAAFELVQPGHGGAAVARAGGDHHRAGAQAPAVGEQHAQLARVFLRAAVQRRHRRRDQGLGAELLGLHIGPPGQGLARDAGGKAQVVLDAGAGAGLAAEGAPVQHQHLQALGGRVHGGGQAGRAGAHDDDVEQLAVVRAVHHADAAAQFRLAGVAQHRTVGADRQRLIRRGAVLLVQGRGVPVLGDVQHMVGKGVAVQEALQPQHAGRARVADQHQAGGSALHQGHAAQDQGAHQALAQVGLGDDQRAQLLGRQQQGLDLALGDAVHQGRPAGQLADLAAELARPVQRELAVRPHAVALHGGDRALEHQEQARAGLAGGVQALAVLEAHRPAEAVDAGHLGRRQHGKHLVPAAGVHRGGHWHGRLAIRRGCR